MEFDFSPEVKKILENIYKEAKAINPGITPRNLMDNIICDWIQLFKGTEGRIYKKNEVVLRNRLKDAFNLVDKTQSQIAEEIGISRAYLGEVVRGNSEPSILLVLLMMQASGLPPARINDIFFLEPMSVD